MMLKLRDYQQQIIAQGTSKLKSLGIIYLAMEVRTGKTLTALGIAGEVKAKKVLFITKKKVIDSQTILSDYNLLQPDFELILINYESIHNIDAHDVDLFIIDEAHGLGAFPKPSLRTKRIKSIVGSKYVILLSGTPTPESWSQIYHQFWISKNSPFNESNFYKWANTYVEVQKVFRSYGNQANDYSKARQHMIEEVLNPYIITYSQKEAGFESKVNETVLHVNMIDKTYKMVERLERDLVLEGKSGIILADTPVKLMQKVHQLYSGTCKLEDGSTVIIDRSKAYFIKQHFSGKKIGIFYKFVAELELLQQVFQSELTTDLHEFNTTSKNIALQIVSGREGISLKLADCLVMYNIDFSATSYWQSRDRMTTKKRAKNDVYWIFSKGGLEDKIYNTVLQKKSFTLKYYERSKISSKANQTA